METFEIMRIESDITLIDLAKTIVALSSNDFINDFEVRNSVYYEFQDILKWAHEKIR